jgi:hypothetical protein
VAISAGDLHTCALLDNNRVRCWGDGVYGRLGYCSTSDIGDTPATLPGKVGTVNLRPGDGGAACAATGSQHQPDPRRLEALRARGLRVCFSRAAQRARPQRNRARADCIERYGRKPGRVMELHARASSPTKVVLAFAASGTDGLHPPPARSYIVKQSLAPIRTADGFARAQALCQGRCRFAVVAVGERISLTITHLHPHTRYYYAVAARDNVSGVPGPRSRTVSVTTG